MALKRKAPQTPPTPVYPFDERFDDPFNGQYDADPGALNMGRAAETDNHREKTPGDTDPKTREKVLTQKHNRRSRSPVSFILSWFPLSRREKANRVWWRFWKS